jgi:hypothetical protein
MMVAPMRHYLVEYIVDASFVSSPVLLRVKTPDMGLPDQMMITRIDDS